MKVLITGASSGMGRDMARYLSSFNYKLILVSKDKKNLDKIFKEDKNVIATYGYDLTKEEECINLYNKVKEENIDILINNAGFGDAGKFFETSLNKEMDMINLNIKAYHILTKLFLKDFVKKDHGRILNVASMAGLMPGPYMATYYATKAYVTSLTRAIATELKEQGSRVYIGCLCPGPVDTEFNDVANVNFALKGITASYCANYAVDQMKKRKVVIVPTLTMKCTVFFSRIIPQNLYIKLTGNQQKKKLGK